MVCVTKHGITYRSIDNMVSLERGMEVKRKKKRGMGKPGLLKLLLLTLLHLAAAAAAAAVSGIWVGDHWW